MNEVLLREIVSRILQDPQLQSLLNTPSGAPAKEEFLVFVENQASLQALPEVERRWGAECLLSVCMADFPDCPSAKGSHIAWEKAMAVSNWAKILVPVCSAAQIAHIALGLRTDKLTTLVGWAICQGIAVEIGRVDYGFTERTPEAYRVMLLAQVRQVAAYGVSVASAAGEPAPKQPEAGPVKNRLAEADEVPRQCITVSFDKRLFSAREATLVSPHAVLNIAKSTVLTPSAIDVHKKLKAEVYREGVKFL